MGLKCPAPINYEQWQWIGTAGGTCSNFRTRMVKSCNPKIKGNYCKILPADINIGELLLQVV